MIRYTYLAWDATSARENVTTVAVRVWETPPSVATLQRLLALLCNLALEEPAQAVCVTFGQSAAQLAWQRYLCESFFLLLQLFSYLSM